MTQEQFPCSSLNPDHDSAGVSEEQGGESCRKSCPDQGNSQTAKETHPLKIARMVGIGFGDFDSMLDVQQVARGQEVPLENADIDETVVLTKEMERSTVLLQKGDHPEKESPEEPDFEKEYRKGSDTTDEHLEFTGKSESLSDCVDLSKRARAVSELYGESFPKGDQRIPRDAESIREEGTSRKKDLDEWEQQLLFLKSHCSSLERKVRILIHGLIWGSLVFFIAGVLLGRFVSFSRQSKEAEQKESSSYDIPSQPHLRVAALSGSAFITKKSNGDFFRTGSMTIKLILFPQYKQSRHLFCIGPCNY